jgi:hypothetical protein
MSESMQIQFVIDVNGKHWKNKMLNFTKNKWMSAKMRVFAPLHICQQSNGL